MEKNNVALFGW